LIKNCLKREGYDEFIGDGGEYESYDIVLFSGGDGRPIVRISKSI
jgi:hypothetical protein